MISSDFRSDGRADDRNSGLCGCTQTQLAGSFAAASLESAIRVSFFNFLASNSIDDMATETVKETAHAAQNEVESLADSQADSTNSDLRYAAYGARLRTALRAGTRYVAYVRRLHAQSLKPSLHYAFTDK